VMERDGKRGAEDECVVAKVVRSGVGISRQRAWESQLRSEETIETNEW